MQTDATRCLRKRCLLHVLLGSRISSHCNTSDKYTSSSIDANKARLSPPQKLQTLLPTTLTYFHIRLPAQTEPRWPTSTQSHPSVAREIATGEKSDEQAAYKSLFFRSRFSFFTFLLMRVYSQRQTDSKEDVEGLDEQQSAVHVDEEGAGVEGRNVSVQPPTKRRRLGDGSAASSSSSTASASPHEFVSSLPLVFPRMYPVL